MLKVLHFSQMMFILLAGSVKDSVVGEDRIAQYLLAVLNIRGTPLHWKHWNNRRAEGIRYDSVDNVQHSLKDLRPKRRKPPNASSVMYIEVKVPIKIFSLFFFFFYTMVMPSFCII